MSLAAAPIIRTAICALALASFPAGGGLDAAAVLPNLTEGTTELGGAGSLRAAVLAESDRRTIAGRWEGRTADGRTVVLNLRFDGGLPVGSAQLAGLLPGAPGPVPLLSATAAGRTLSFAVAGCDDQRTRGRFTLQSSHSAKLVLRTGASPVTLQLSKAS